MPYGTIKIDTVTFTDGGVDKSVSISGLVQNPTFSGNVTITGTISGNLVRGQTVSGVIVTGTTATFSTGIFTSLTGTTSQGTTATYTSGGFTSLTGVTTSGTTANFVSGVFSTQLSGATITGNVGAFTTLTGGVTTLTSGVFAAGSAASPSITFTGDLNTGIYSPGADQVAISTNGTGRLFVNASGLVGIGTTSPGVPLTVQADSNAFANDLIGRAADNTSIIRFKTSDNSTALGSIGQYGTTMNINSIGAGPIAFYTTNTERARIDSSGRLLVGTSSAYNVGGFQRSNYFASDDNEHVVISAAGGFGPYPAIYFTKTRAATPGAATTAVADGDKLGAIEFYGANGTDFSNIAGWITCEVDGQPFTSGDTTDLPGRLVFSTTADGASSPTERMRIASAGNVGIGTTSPARTLQIQATSASFGISNTGGDSLAIDPPTGGFAQIDVSGANALRFNTNGSERARIDSSGRLLVGTSSARETNTGNDPFVQFERSSGSALVLSATKNGADAFGPYFTLIKSRGTSAGANNLVSSGDELGSILFYGTDGTNPEAGAAIQAYVDGTPGANDMPGRLVFSTTADGASSPTERMRITSGGDVRIGTAAALDVGSGTDDGFRFLAPGTAAGIFQCSNNDVVGYFRRRSSDGTMLSFRRDTTQVGTIAVTTTATAYNTSSDYRLKENVTPVTDGITRLQQLKPSRFNFIADPDKTVDGFLAHEVQDVVPEAISGEKDAVDDDGNPVYQGIDQSKLVPLLTAALQEAIGEIESLKARVAALESV